VIDAELVFPGASGVPDFGGLRTAFGVGRQDELAVFAFDLMHRDGDDLTGLPLSERRKRLERLLVQSDVPCLQGRGAVHCGRAARAGGHRLETPRVTLSLWAIP